MEWIKWSEGLSNIISAPFLYEFDWNSIFGDLHFSVESC